MSNPEKIFKEMHTQDGDAEGTMRREKASHTLARNRRKETDRLARVLETEGRVSALEAAQCVSAMRKEQWSVVEAFVSRAGMAAQEEVLLQFIANVNGNLQKEVAALLESNRFVDRQETESDIMNREDALAAEQPYPVPE